MYPPASVITLVIAPSCIVTNAVPSGTTTLDPLLITFSFPFTLAPLLLLIPLAIPGKTAAVAVRLSFGA